ncbi:MPT63 family protein [Mycobacterium deserti]|uniref:MPT63 family protein n=1 Tax=Mycobacterium deserti TaxID=2978347 RepID=A0ABT2M7A8_9MYCO|nr:MPT63 family protein [Mycobacterium deserti]MCT7657821.1 MPT63 family protein [Mycobacterium deserti]
MSKMTGAATFAAAGAIGLMGAPLAAAEAGAAGVTTQNIGSAGKLVDGNVIQEWTVSDLKPSSDVIPHPVSGTLWEATATDQAVQGSVTPIVSNFNARAENGQTYRVLFGAATPQGVNPATIAQGAKTTGKVYFDVTGEKPDSIVYNAGGRDLLVWEQAAPSASQSSPARSYPSTRYPAQSPASAAPAETPAAAEAAPEAPGAPPAADGTELPLPAGSQGTPLPAGSQGTPLPAGSQGTPLPAGSQGTPLPPGAPGEVPASTEGTPLPAGTSQGTPLPEGGEQVQTPSTYLPTP